MAHESSKKAVGSTRRHGSDCFVLLRTGTLLRGFQPVNCMGSSAPSFRSRQPQPTSALLGCVVMSVGAQLMPEPARLNQVNTLTALS